MAFRAERRAKLNFKQAEAARDSGPAAPIEPQVVGADIQSISVPGFATPDSTIRITGTVHYNNISRPLTQTPVRMVIDSPALTDTVMEQTPADDSLAHCNSRPFVFPNVPITLEAGQVQLLEIKSQSDTGLGFSTDETIQRDVRVVTEGEAQTRRAQQYVPWVGVGAGIGAAAGSRVGSPVRGALIGGVGGAVGKAATDQIRIRAPSVGTPELIAGAIVLGSAGFFLKQARGISIPLLPGV